MNHRVHILALIFCFQIGYRCAAEDGPLIINDLRIIVKDGLIVNFKDIDPKQLGVMSMSQKGVIINGQQIRTPSSPLDFSFPSTSELAKYLDSYAITSAGIKWHEALIRGDEKIKYADDSPEQMQTQKAIYVESLKMLSTKRESILLKIKKLLVETKVSSADYRRAKQILGTSFPLESKSP